MKGKIQIIKSLLLPQLNYVLSNIYCPSQILKEIDKILIRFLWNNNPPKVKKSTIIGNYSDGGLKMPDIFTINTTAKVKWIKRLMASSTFAGNWQGLFLYLLNIDKNLLKHKLPSKVKDKGLTPFYKQVLECWGEFHGNEPDTVEEICNEFIFNNKYICSNKEPLQVGLLKMPNTKMFKDMNIKDIIGKEGDILSLEHFCNKYNIHMDPLSYNRLISSIPKFWKEKIKLERNLVITQKTTTIKARGRLKDISKVSNKALYWIALDKIYKEPTAVDAWIINFPFLANAPWHIIFKTTHTISPEPYLHSFQYKIVNRILNCGTNLYKWKVKDSPNCSYCDEIHT